MISNASAAPSPVRLSDGNIVILSPLTAQDVTSVLQFARQRELRNMLSAIPPEADVKTRKMMTQTAFEESRNFDVNDTSLWEDMEVLKMVLYFSLRHNHADMTVEKVSKLMENQEDWALMMAALNGDVPKEEPAEEEKKTS